MTKQHEMSHRARQAERAAQYLTGPMVEARYNITAMTVHRWRRKPGLFLPSPVKINNRNY